MTSSLEENVNPLLKRIELIRGEDEEGRPTYRDSPYLKAILLYLDENQENSKDVYSFCYDTYRFVADSYTSMGRFSLAGECRNKALVIAKRVRDEFGVYLKDIDGLAYNLLRDRNFYVDDDCEDVKPLLTGLLAEERIEALFAERMKRRRHFVQDPVEMSKAYLAIIDEIEERIEKNRTIFGMGACFEIWTLKSEYLMEKGIYWQSPALLNPNVRFD